MQGKKKMFYDSLYTVIYNRRKLIYLPAIGLKIRKCHTLSVLIHVPSYFYYNEIFNNPVTHYSPHGFATWISLVNNLLFSFTLENLVLPLSIFPAAVSEPMITVQPHLTHS